MAGKSNNEWGCGTFLILGLALAFITEYWYYIVGVIALILIIIVLFRYFSHQEKLKDEESKKYDYRKIEENKIDFLGQLILGPGRYVSGRDIESGIYDVVLLQGYGRIKTDAPEKINIYFDSEDCQYHNLEISKESILQIDGGLRIKLTNKRDYIEKTNNDLRGEDRETCLDNEKKDECDFDNLDGHEFEYFCANVLKDQGYQNVEVTRGSGDQGVDVLAEMNGIKYAVQCKRFQGHVGNKAVQEIYSGKKFYHCHVGIVMTNNYFTQSAKEAARELGVILWDRDFLMKFSNRSVESNYIDEEEIFTPLLEANKLPIQILPIDENICMKKTEEKNMYDVKNGIYPPGQYLVGRDIPLGIYLLKARKDAIGQVDLYANYNDFKEDNNLRYDNFDDDYFLSLNEENLYLVVRSADIKKL